MRARVEKPGDVVTSAGMFGEVLRDIRETAVLTQAQVAERIPCDRSQIARIELGTRVPSLDMVRVLDRILETGGFLARIWRKVDWYPDIEHPDWFQRRAAMDAEAVAMLVYETMVIPGLVQTEEYIRAQFAQTMDPASTEFAELVRARLSRQLRFLDADGPLLILVLDESCIRNVVGGPGVMKRQCELLLTLAQQPNVILQIAPFAKPGLVAPRRPMTLITMPNGDRWVYSESLDKGHLSNDPAAFTRHLQSYDVLRAAGLSPDESVALIRTAMEGYADDEHPRPQRRKVGQEQLQQQQRRRLRRGGPRLYGRRPRP